MVQKSRSWILAVGLLTSIVLVLGFLFTYRATTSAPHPNIVLVILDTVRADTFVAAEAQPQLTPNIARLMAASSTFTKAYTPAPWTLPSHASLFTGLYPSRHQATHGSFKLGTGMTTMAEYLRASGYTTAGFSCNPWVSRANGFGQGFTTYEEPFRHAGSAIDKGAAQAADMIVAWIVNHATDNRTTDTPFFLFANFLEAHLPYAPPPGILQQMNLGESGGGETQFTVEQAEQHIIGTEPLTVAELAHARSLYQAEIRYLDEQVGKIITSLANLEILDDTVVIITSDHGEHLGEQRLCGHEFSLYESLLHIPLIVRYPARLPAGARNSTFVSLVDLLPTVLELTGHSQASYAGMGRSLLNLPDPANEDSRPLFAEYSQPRKLIEHYWRGKYPEVVMSHHNVALRSVRLGEYKYIQSGDGREELYNLAKDPAELDNLSSQLVQKKASLRELLRLNLAPLTGAFAGGRQVATPDSTPPMDAARLKKLRSLGYVR